MWWTSEMREMTQPGRMLNQARSTTTAPPRNRHVPCLLSTSLSFVTWLAVGRAAFAQAGFPAANDDETSSAAVAPVAGAEIIPDPLSVIIKPGRQARSLSLQLSPGA